MAAGILSTAPRSPWLSAEPRPWVRRESNSALISYTLEAAAPSRILTSRVAVMDSHSLQKIPVKEKVKNIRKERNHRDQVLHPFLSTDEETKEQG